MSNEESKPLDSSGGSRKQLLFGGGGVLAIAAILGAVLAARPSTPSPVAPGVSSASPVSSATPPEEPSLPVERGETVPSSSASVAPAAVSSTPVSPNVRVTVRIFPAVQATVTMGKTRLGTINPRGSLVLERRRDSGPLDLVIRAAGYVTVHTRAYTFEDNTIEVRLTRLDKKDTIYGYRQPLPPEEVSSAEPIRQWVPLSQLLGGAAPSTAPAAVPPPAVTPPPVSSSLPR